MATVPWGQNEYVHGVHMELCYEECFNCPFDECTPDRAASEECPRKQCELRMLREAGILPEGKLTLDEAAWAIGAHPGNVRYVLAREGLHGAVHRVNSLRWRLFEREDIERLAAMKTTLEGEYLTTMEAAEKFGRSRNAISNYCARGLVPGAVRRGRQWLIPEELREIRLRSEVVEAIGVEAGDG